MKQDMICIIYVNDTIFAEPNQAIIDEEIKLIRIENPIKNNHSSSEMKDNYPHSLE